MSPITISLIVFTSVFGGALLGIFLHSSLPQHHLSTESKDIVKLGMGLVGTMAALVLGLLVASAKGSYEAQRAELTQMSANIALLDRILALYGPETKEPRDVLRSATARLLDQLWSEDGTPKAPPSRGGENVYDKIVGLWPKNDREHSLHNQALRILLDIEKTRWLMFEQATISVSMPLLVVLVVWLTAISSVSACSLLLMRPWFPVYSSPRCRFPAHSS